MGYAGLAGYKLYRKDFVEAESEYRLRSGNGKQ